MDPAVFDRPFGVPGSEDGGYRPLQLIRGVVGELSRALPIDDLTESRCGVLEVFSGELRVVLDTSFLSELREDLLELGLRSLDEIEARIDELNRIIDEADDELDEE